MAKHQPSTQVDLRRFTYALAPLKAKHQWTLAQADIRLSKARMHLAKKKAELEHALAQRESHLQWMHTCESMLSDLGLRRQSIVHLVRLDAQIDEAKKDVDHASQSCKACVAECEALRLKLDVLDDHHRLQLTDFQKEELRTAYAEQDRDWMARAQSQATETDQPLAHADIRRPHEQFG